MIRIAICDDEQRFIDDLRTALDEIVMQESEDIDVETYIEGSRFIEELESGKRFDLIFMDIMMPDIDGIEIGYFIREKLKDNITQLVYISSENKYAMRLFKVQPLDFIIKPIEIQEIKFVIKKAIDLTTRSNKYFVFYNNRGIVRVPFKEIIYFESVKRDVYVCTQNEKYKINETLNSLYDKVKDNDFVFSHRSFLVNFNYVRNIMGNFIILSNGEEIPMSKSKKEEVFKKCMTSLFL